MSIKHTMYWLHNSENSLLYLRVNHLSLWVFDPFKNVCIYHNIKLMFSFTSLKMFASNTISNECFHSPLQICLHLPQYQINVFIHLSKNACIQSGMITIPGFSRQLKTLFHFTIWSVEKQYKCVSLNYTMENVKGQTTHGGQIIWSCVDSLQKQVQLWSKSIDNDIHI